MGEVSLGAGEQGSLTQTQAELEQNMILMNVCLDQMYLPDLSALPLAEVGSQQVPPLVQQEGRPGGQRGLHIRVCHLGASAVCICMCELVGFLGLGQQAV